MNWKPLRKIVATALSGLTTTGVVAFLSETGVDVPASVAAVVVAVASALAGYLVPEKKTTKTI